MTTDFSFLQKVLKPYAYEDVHIGNEHALIKSVAFYDHLQEGFVPDVLYILQEDIVVNNLPPQGTVTILCVENCTMQFDISFDSCLNLIVVKQTADLLEIINHIQEALVEQQSLDFWSGELMSLLAENTNLHELIVMGRKILGNPVFITDTHGKCIGISQEEIPDDIAWSEFSASGHISYNSYIYGSTKQMHSAIDNSVTPFIWADSNIKYRRILSKLALHKKRLGTMTVVEYTRPFKNEDIALATLLSDIFCIALHGTDPVEFGMQGKAENILEELISGNITKYDIEMLEAKRNLKKMIPMASLCILSIDASKIIDNSHLSATSFKGILENEFKNSLSIEYKGYFTFLLTSEKKQYPFNNEVALLKDFLDNKPMCAGISQNFYKLEDIQGQYLKSVKALELGKMMKATETVYTYDDYAIYHIAQECSKNEELKKYYHPSLQKLIEYDDRNHTELIQTLTAYIACFRNITDTAGELHIHRNSLIYRLEKINEITKADLSNSNILLQFHMTLKLMEYDMRCI